MLAKNLNLSLNKKINLLLTLFNILISLIIQTTSLTIPQIRS
jgi:hypothetical protein